MPYTNDPRFLDLFDVRRIGARSQSGLDLSIQVGFLLIVVLVSISAWLNHRHTNLVLENGAYVARTHEVLGVVRASLTELVTAESSARAYLLTGSEEPLGTYDAALVRLDAQLDELLAATETYPGESSSAGTLKMRVELRRAELARLVESGRVGILDPAARIAATNEGRELMDDVREVVEQIEAAQGALLLEREALVRSSFTTAKTTGVALGLSVIFLVVLVYNLVRRFERLRSSSEREMANARERFQVALGSIGDAVLVVDPQGRVAFCNEGCRSMLGIDNDRIGGLLDDIVASVSDSTGEEREWIYRRALAEGGVHRTLGDVAIRRADGSRIPVDATAASILGQNGEKQGAVLVLRDVSQRRERERELARSNERFRSLVLATAQVVWTTDHTGQIREDSVSWRQLTGQTYEQWQGEGAFDAIHPEDRARVIHQWRECIQSKQPFSAEYRLKMADGSYRWSLARAVPVVVPDGKVREWVGMNRDVHERKQSEDIERNANRRKDEFIALLAHEIRNPLAPLRNGIEVLKSGPQNESHRALEMMDRQVRHMVRLIDDLLDVSRISQGKLDLRLEKLDLREVLRQSVEAVRPAAQAKRQVLAVSLPSAPLWVDGDPVRLTQVVMNLLNNAVKYSGEESGIWLTAEREGHTHVVNVRDTGQGIATDMRPRIWDLFLQGGGRVERIEGGLGIGLTLVKRLVELHNGSVDVQSEGVGAGSEFSVRLPVAAPPVTVVPALPAPARPATRAVRVLVVDDNEDSAESLSMLLRISGHNVRVAFRGDEGLREYVRFAPELVLCDIRMPDMSGYEVARSLRALKGGDRALLVALTGFGAEADREATARAGFDRHVVKPLDPDVLVDLMRDAATRAHPPDKVDATP